MLNVDRTGFGVYDLLELSSFSFFAQLITLFTMRFVGKSDIPFDSPKAVRGKKGDKSHMRFLQFYQAIYLTINVVNYTLGCAPPTAWVDLRRAVN